MPLVEDSRCDVAVAPDREELPSRRAVLAAAAGGAAAVFAALARPTRTEAAAGSPLIIGSSANDAGLANTQLVTSSTVVAFKLLQFGPGTALMGYASASSGVTRGVYGRVDSPNGDAVQARNGAVGMGTGSAIRAFGGKNSGIIATSDAGDGVRSTSITGAGVTANSTNGNGVSGVSSTASGVYGLQTTASNTNSAGVYGASTNGVGVVGRGSIYGVFGFSSPSVGVLGESDTGDGVFGQSSEGKGVHGSSADSYGVWGTSDTSFAGYFEGPVGVTRDLEMTEMPAPSAPSANLGRIFLRDNGGKTELCVIFNTGGIQVIAAQP